MHVSHNFTTLANDEGRTTVTDLIVGGSMMMLSTLCAVAYLVILVTIWHDKELKALTSYQLMMVLGVFDVLQCIAHFITGIFTICQSVFHHYLAKGISIFGTPCYVAYCVITIMLTLNRFNHVVVPRFNEKLFNSRTARYIWAGVVAVSWCYFAFFFVSPWATMVYVPRYYVWKYDFSLKLTLTIQKSAIIIESICVVTIIFFYSYVIIFTYTQRKRYISNIGNNHAEIKILIQALVIGVYCAVLNILWHTSQNIRTNLWLQAGLNFMWLLSSGVHPLIYFIVNRTIRRRINPTHQTNLRLPANVLVSKGNIRNQTKHF